MSNIDNWVLLASSNTLNGIKDSIKKFYCGEEKKIEGNDIFKSNGAKLENVRVIKKGSRYRFEMKTA